MISESQSDARGAGPALSVEEVDHLVPLAIVGMITDEESITNFHIRTRILP